MAKTNRSTATRFFLPQQHLEWEIRCNVQLSSRWVVGFLCSQNSPTGSFSLLRDGKSPNSPTIRLNMTCHHRSLQKKPDPTQFWVRGFVWGPSKGSCAHHNFHPFDLFWLPKATPVLTTSKLTSLWHGLTTHQVHSQEPTLRGRKTPRDLAVSESQWKIHGLQCSPSGNDKTHETLMSLGMLPQLAMITTRLA